MKILLDCRYQRGAGPNITSDYLVDELLRVNEHNQYLILQHKNQVVTDRDNVKRLFVPSRNRWLEFLWVQFVLPRIIKREGIDLYHSLKHFGPLYTSVPVILPVRAVSQFLEGMQELSLTDRLYWREMGRLAWRRATHILAVSGVCRDVLVEKVGIEPDKIQIIHHGVNSFFCPVPKSQIPAGLLDSKGLNGPYLLCVGNPYPHKKYDTAVRTLARLKEIAPATRDYKLAIVGDPMYVTDALRRLIDELGLRDAVVFTGFVPHEKLRYIYAGAELLLFCSLYEAFPNPIVEAMACGIPVIAAKRGAVAEIAGDGARLIESPEDVEAFAAAAKDLIENEAHRDELVSAARERAAAFSWPNTAQTVRDVYARFDNDRSI